MEVISDAPQANSFVPLIEHQSATPASFYSGPPVLHYYSQRCKVIIFESDIPKSPALQTLAQGAVKLNMTNGNSVNEGSIAEVPNPAEVSSAQKIISDIDVWVTSESVCQTGGDGL